MRIFQTQLIQIQLRVISLHLRPQRVIESTSNRTFGGNRGSAGIDGITIEEFEQNSQQNLAEIERQLKKKSHRYYLICTKE